MDQCGTCRHASIGFNPEDPEEPTMECRRYPPQVFVLDGEAAQAFPSIDPDMSCGEWAPDPDIPPPSRKPPSPRRNPSG